MSLKKLPPETIKLISSTQVITSASSVVKELMENSIDAHATIIDIRLDNYGLDKIEIQDNGIGVPHSDVHVMCLSGYTSKISEIADLDKLMSYGFRGEALSSICAVADVTIITKSESDIYAKSFTMDKNGQVKNSSISHHQKGTVIKIVDLFKNLPVRKQIYNTKKYCVNDLRRIENIIKSLFAIQQNIRVSLVHNKCVIWQMSPVSDITVTFGQIWSSSMTKYVKHLQFSNVEMTIDIVLPVQNIDVQNCFYTTNMTDSIYLYVNKRPVRDNKIEKLITGEFSNYFGHYLSPGKYLPCFISLTIPAETIDVNVEPDKSRILFHNQETIIFNIQNCIRKHFYCDKVDTIQPNTDEIPTYPSNKRKTSNDLKEIIVKKPVILMSKMNAVSTDFNNENHPHIPMESSLGEIVSEEPSTSEENKNDKKMCLELEKTYDVSKYCGQPINLEQTFPYKIIQLDNTNVKNLNTENIENISASQWSKGDVDINEQLLESRVKSDVLSKTLENKSLLEIEEASEILHSKYTAETQINKLNEEEEEEENNTVHNNNSVSKISSNSNIKLDPHSCMVSIPDDNDDQAPKFNDLINNPQSWIPEPNLNRSTQDIPGVDLSETVRCVSSQIANKDMAGFTVFAKELKLKILRENPGMDFTKVSNKISRLWACLSVDEKKSYKKLANKRTNLAIITEINDTPLPKKSFQFIFKTLNRCSTLINVDISEIKKNISEKPKVLPCPPFILIGEVKENNWICCVQNEIQAINTYRLQEAVVFFQKMVDDEIPLKMLYKSIKTSKKYLGEKNYRFLRDLDTSYEPSARKYTIIDERIVKNGFNVVIELNDDPENPDISITDVALHISTYGAEELKQLLELMQLEKDNGLYFCRPLKVVNYLRSETARHCKTIGLPIMKQEIHELLNYWFKHEKLFSNNTCIHYKQVFTSVHIIDENPKTFKCI